MKHHLIPLTLGVAAFAALSVHANADTISCESREYRYQHCDANTGGHARLLSQHSQAPCIEGQTWGADRGGIWVNKGCAAEFEVGGSRWREGPPPRSSGYGGGVPRWAVGTFHGANAEGRPQTITINPDGVVTLRDRGGGGAERGTYNGDSANFPSGQVGIDPAGQNGILVNGQYFAR